MFHHPCVCTCKQPEKAQLVNRVFRRGRATLATGFLGVASVARIRCVQSKASTTDKVLTCVTRSLLALVTCANRGHVQCNTPYCLLHHGMLGRLFRCSFLTMRIVRLLVASRTVRSWKPRRLWTGETLDHQCRARSSDQECMHPAAARRSR